MGKSSDTSQNLVGGVRPTNGVGAVLLRAMQARIAASRERVLRCGRAAPICRFRLEHLRMIGGWGLQAAAEYVTWSGHARELVPIPQVDGTCPLVPMSEVAC